MKNRFTLILFFLPLLVVAQMSSPISGVPEAGMLPAFNNPAALQIPKDTKWTANLLTVNAWGNANTGSLSVKDFSQLNVDLLRSHILGTALISTGSGGFEIKGPSAAFRLNKKLVLGFSTEVRLLANYWEVNGRLVSEVGEITKAEQAYPYAIQGNENMRMNTAVYSSIGTMLNYELWKNDRHALYTGLALKYINGTAHTSLEVLNIDGILNLDPNKASYLTAATGQVSTLTSGHLLDKVNAGNLFKPRKGSVSGDIGVEYRFSDGPDKSPKLRLGLSVTDIGQVRYQSDSNFSKSYNITIPANDRLYFNNNFNNSSFSHTAEVFDTYPRLFQKTSTSRGDYKIQLPTKLLIQVDYKVCSKLSINANATIGLTPKKRIEKLYSYSGFNLTPRWTAKDFVIFLPLSYYEYAGFNAGIGLKYRSVFIASNSALSLLVSKPRQIDLSFGILLNIKKPN